MTRFLMRAPCLLAALALSVSAGQAQRTRPDAVLESAPRLQFPAATDSNSPVFWQLRHGRNWLHLITSSPAPKLSVGYGLDDFGTPSPVGFDNSINGRRWFEAVLPDHDRTLYRYYHNEPENVCPATGKTAPRIGAARSENGGRTWIDLGIILEAPPGSERCNTPNRYFVGGVGDFSVVLGSGEEYLYIFFSAYPRTVERQGVAVARMRWGDRDDPVGRVAVWDDGVWRYPEWTEDEQLVHGSAAPIFRATHSWHGSGAVDAFWGPSVHWNTFLQRYVMLLNRAKDGEFSQEGIYSSSAESLDDPREWSSPKRLLSGGKWYPQVVGSEWGLGADRLAGERARLFVGGVSDYEIVFQRPGEQANPR